MADGWAAHVQGALGEYAVGKGLGIFWPGPGKLRHPDLGANIQVRSRVKGKTNSLIVHPEDKDADLFVLALFTGYLQVELAGFTTGLEGKQQHYWAEKVNGRPAYYVPIPDLSPMSSLMPVERSQVLHRLA